MNLHYGKLAVLAACILISGYVLSAFAYKPAYPIKINTYISSDKTVRVAVKPAGYSEGHVTVTLGNRDYQWKNKILLPHTVVVTSDNIFFLGGYGNPSIALGKIGIYSFRGKRLKIIELGKQIADLEKISSRYRKICCPFPWVHSAKISRDGKKLRINVCRKVTTVIDIKGYTVKIK